MIKIKHARTADCVVAGFRWHKNGRRAGRLAAARPVRRRPGTCTTWRHVVVHDGGRRQLADGARAAANGSPGRPPVAGVGRQRRLDANARRPEPLERRQGPVVGAPRGSSACARSNTTTCRATDSGTPPCSSVAARPPAEGLPLDQLEVTTPYELQRLRRERGDAGAAALVSPARSAGQKTLH